MKLEQIKKAPISRYLNLKVKGAVTQPLNKTLDSPELAEIQLHQEKDIHCNLLHLWKTSGRKQLRIKHRKILKQCKRYKIPKI